MSAANHFATHGVARANINTISVDAGYARGTVYNYFESKDALFAAVLNQGVEQVVTDYREAVKGRDLGAREHLLTLIEADVALVQAHDAFMRSTLAEIFSPRPETQAAIDAAMRPFVTVLMEIFARGQAAGDVRSDLTAPQLALFTMGQLTAVYAMQFRAPAGSRDWGAVPELLVTLVVDGAGHR